MDLDTTPFSNVYSSFFSKITDDMYMELDKTQTERMLENLLVTAIQKFEFPRVNINNYELAYYEDDKEVTGGRFNVALTAEEINIISTYMIVEWFGYQLASVENVRMKYSGSDFKFTSQANHMSKILQLKKDYEREGFHLQRLYKRRKADDEGIMRSTFGTVMAKYPEGRI